MRAVDTNVLIRLITRDDAKQTAACEAFVAAGAWISHLVLAEAMWVLESVFELSVEKIIVTVEMLLNHDTLTVQDSDVVEAALRRFRRRSAPDFSDCLILEIARKTGNLPLGTFDRALSKIDGAERL
ncbi:MAG TPA: type II toxin-antitoxin system VapC family toxin [Casimicrobiaceae bacterium]|jgi:predicted nucleic-acid-binding protein